MMSFLLCCLSSSNPASSRHRHSSSRLKRSALQAAANNLTKIFEELKCPVCFNICVPPIHNCINGHIICNTCRLKGHVTTCPTCRQSLSCGARNMFAENFVLNYAQQCCYASQGCEHLRLKGCSMKPHEDKCMFRPIKCIVGTCGLHIPYKNFLAHLDCGHKASGTDCLPTVVQFKYNPNKRSGGGGRGGGTNKWLPYYIQAFDNVYYVMMQRIHKIFWIWVYSQLAKESDDMEYTYNAYIKLRHPEKKIYLSWHGPVYPIRTPFRTVQEEGCAFTLPSALVKNFSAGGNLNFSVDIRKIPRRTLKGIKLPGEGDSETAVVSGGLPQEYNRPPSFYEPNLIQSTQEAPLPSQNRTSTPQDEEITPCTTTEENGGDSPLNHHTLQYSAFMSSSSSSPRAALFPKNLKDDLLLLVAHVPPPSPPKRRMPRTAAIGIPSLNLPLSETSTVASLLDTTLPPANLLSSSTPNTACSSSYPDCDDDGFGDKISYQRSSELKIHKKFYDYLKPSN